MKDYLHDPWKLYWTIVNLMIAHYSPELDFDLACLNVADRFRRDGDIERALWIKQMVEAHEVPSREWEDGLLDAAYGVMPDGE